MRTDRPRRVYITERGRPGRKRHTYRVIVEPMTTADVELYRQVWAMRRALGRKYSTGALFAEGLRLLAVRLRRECARAGVDWLGVLEAAEAKMDRPNDPDRSRLDALEERRRHRPIVDAPDR